MIRRGLRIDDDSDNQIKEEVIKIDPNRKKNVFQKDMDDLLFGSAPARRKQHHKSSFQQKTQNSHENLNLSSSKIKQQISNKQERIPSNKYKQKTIDEGYLLTQSRKKSIPKKQQNQSLRNSKVSIKKLSIIQQKEQDQKKKLQSNQQSTIFRQIDSTKPNYIRKFRYVSQTYDFKQENSKKHKCIDVVRPIMCSKNSITNIDVQNFEDKQFPPLKISLGPQNQNYQVKWKKYESFVNHATLGKYIDPNDIKKGRFSSHGFLSILSVLAQRQENIKRLLEDQYFNSGKGLYFVRIFLNSVWRYYKLDSYVPFLEDQPVCGMSYNDTESDMWVSLIQKAYAKAFNGYDVFTRPQPIQYYLRDLTGAPISKISSDNDDLLNIVNKAVRDKKIIYADLKSHSLILGLNPNYSLTVLNTNKKGGLTLRYSWPLILEKPKIPISKEGILEFSDNQLSEYISQISVAHLNRQFFTTTVQTRHEKGFYVAYKIIAKQNIQGYFTISQFDERQFPKNTYNYQPATLFIHKKVNDKFQYVKGGFSYNQRNLDVQVQLIPGEYHLFAYVNWNTQVYDFNLTFYGSKIIDFIKIETFFNHNLVSQGLQTYNLQNGKRSALGHVHQFISYHEETNFILISVFNTSSKDYQYINDLQKINFQSLTLLNLTNNKHGMLLNLNEKELKSFKLTINQNRKWQINLGPQEVFTWVIAVSSQYNPNNFRTWGFR